MFLYRFKYDLVQEWKNVMLWQYLVLKARIQISWLGKEEEKNISAEVFCIAREDCT